MRRPPNPGGPGPAAPEAGATAAPRRCSARCSLDADWIGTDNARGRDAQFWIDTWKERNPSYTIDFQAKGDVIVRLASDTYGHMIQFPPHEFRRVPGQAGLFVGIDREMAARRITADSFFGIPEIETWEGSAWDSLADQRLRLDVQPQPFFEQLGVCCRRTIAGRTKTPSRRASA